MPQIDTNNAALKTLKGMHIWHADMSSCSQRVRIALAEKNQNYTGHLINLHAGENASEEFQAIHPKGLVPAMVIDGKLYIESVDIIDEIDRHDGTPTLRPTDGTEDEVLRIMSVADKAQTPLKLLTFEFLFSAAPPPPIEILEAFQRNHKNEYLKKFHRDFGAGFSRDRVYEAAAQCHIDFKMLDNLLADGRPYLAGENFSLADVAWMPNFHRFDLILWPFENYPHLKAWFASVKQRKSYQDGLVDWEPEGFNDMVAPAIAARKKKGDGVDAYLPN